MSENGRNACIKSRYYKKDLKLRNMSFIICVMGIFLQFGKEEQNREKGKILFSRYIILDTLYSARNSEVYLSKHIGLNDKRIIKKLFKNLLCEENFHSEAKVLKNLRHNGIPIIYDIEEDEDAYYIIEEYIAGENLYEYVRNRGVLTEEMAISFAIQIAEIIVYLHGLKPVPILYLDLKPQNIIVNNGKVYIVDFGNSRFVNEDRMYISGTKGFAAPEQYTFEELDFSTDVYGIGALLYFMVFGNICEDAKMIAMDTNIHISTNLKNIIIQCMSPKNIRTKNAYMVAKNLSEIIHEKIRKKEKDNKELVEKPLRISVLGAQQHIGVTHFSLALTGRLNERGIRTVYEDKNGKVIRAIYENSGKCELSSGIYRFENIFMKYSYSNMISLEMNVQCLIEDCSGEMISESLLEQSDFLILIVGGKEWEINESINAIEFIEKVKNKESVLVLWNYVQSTEKACIPMFCNPFNRDISINTFFDNVINMILEEENANKEENKKRFFGFFTRNK